MQNERRVTADGRILEKLPNGTIVEVGQQGGQGVVLPPPPTAQYEAPQAAANVERTQTQTQGDAISNQVAAGTAPTTIQTNQAPAGYIWIDPNDPEKGVRPIPGYESQQAEQLDAQKLGNMRSLQQLLTRLQGLYALGPGSTEGVAGVADYLPTENNRRFNTVAAGLGDVGFAAFRVPGSGVQTDADQKRFIDANTPSTWDTDVQIQEKLANVQTRLNETAAAFGLDPEELTSPLPSAFDVIRTDGGAGQERKPADAGSTTESIAAPPQMVQEHDEMVALLASQNGGRIDPDQYAAERARLDAKYNRQGNIEDYKGWATSVNDYLDAGGRTIPTGIQDETRVMSMTDTLRNNLVSNPVGAAATGYFNAGGMGALNALAPDQAAALADAYPLSSLGGEIGGAITGTALLGGLARNTVGRAAPRLLGGGARSQTARNIGTDAAYAGGYSANSGDDIATGTALGVGGSAFGQALGKLTGAAVGGLQRTAPAQALIDRGVRLSIGRQLGGGAARAEDLLQSVPFVGGQVRNRQADSFTDFNRAAFEEGAKPLSGFNPNAIGREGIEQFDLAVSDAYQNALGGRSIPLDPQFTDDLVPSVNARMELPADVQARADKLIENHLGPIGDTGQITGEAYQRARRGLGKARNNANQIAGEFDQPYRETMTGVLDALDAQLARGGGADIVENLNLANAANKNLRILEDASLDRAKIGTQTGEVEVFTPAQLLAASRGSEKNFGGATGLRELGQAGQEVLPSTVPNSGTADRAMAAAALGTTGVGLAGLGAGTGYAIGGQGGVDEGAFTGAGLAAALAILGTRQGQQLVQRALIDRPEGMRRAGRAITARRGLFGSAMLPVVAQD